MVVWRCGEATLVLFRSVASSNHKADLWRTWYGLGGYCSFGISLSICSSLALGSDVGLLFRFAFFEPLVSGGRIGSYLVVIRFRSFDVLCSDGCGIFGASFYCRLVDG